MVMTPVPPTPVTRTPYVSSSEATWGSGSAISGVDPPPARTAFALWGMAPKTETKLGQKPFAQE